VNGDPCHACGRVGTHAAGCTSVTPGWSITPPVDPREQRRYEIARDVLAGMHANPTVGNSIRIMVECSVEAADALLKALGE
jgi:hypothetical protein